MLGLSLCSVDSSWAEAGLERARKDKNFDFRQFKEPYGAPQNCIVRLRKYQEECPSYGSCAVSNNPSMIDIHANLFARP